MTTIVPRVPVLEMARVALGVVLVVACALMVSPASAQLACGGTVGPGGTFTMTTDLANCGANPALSVVGPAVLDMKGHTIGCGIRPQIGLALRQSGATVKNGAVLNCTDGVELLDGGRHTVRSLVVTTDEPLLSPFEGGIAFLVSSDRNTLSGNMARSTTLQQPDFTLTQNGFGYKVTGDDNRLQGDTAANNRTGFFVTGSGNTFSQSTASDCTDGFVANAGTRNHFTGNLAVRSTDAGLLVLGGGKNVLSGNTVIASDNGDNFKQTPSGIGIGGDGGNTIQNNAAFSNAFVGIEVDSSGNTISGNRALGNGAGDLVDGSGPTFSGCTTNVWRNNLFGTRNQTCVH